jgi:hypothetical protein
MKEENNIKRFNKEINIKRLAEENRDYKKIKKLKPILKIIFFIIGIIIFITMLFYAVPYMLGIFFKDISSIDDSDLQLETIIVSEEENAYYDLLELSDVDEYYSDEYLSDFYDQYMENGTFIGVDDWDEVQINDVILGNDKIFNLIDQIAEKSIFQELVLSSPETISWDMIVRSIRGLTSKLELSHLKSVYLFRGGDEKGFLNEMIKSLKIGQMIQDSQAVLIQQLVGVALKIKGLEEIQQAIPLLTLTSDEIVSYVNELQNFKENKDGWALSLKVEYNMFLSVIDSMINGNMEFFGEPTDMVTKKLKNGYSFQINKTKQLFADNTRLHINNFQKPCGLIDEPKFVLEWKIPGSGYLASKMNMILTENWAGKAIHDITVVSYKNMFNRSCEADLMLSSSRILMAIKAYKIDTGDYPESLEKLVPQYISELPQDPFSGDKLKYSKEKKIIYSVGKDLIDLGGSKGDEWRDMDNPTFRIEF